MHLMWVKSCDEDALYVITVLNSVADPDLYVFGPPGSGSIRTRYESGSLYHHSKIVRKGLILLLCDFSITFYLWKSLQKVKSWCISQRCGGVPSVPIMFPASTVTWPIIPHTCCTYIITRPCLPILKYTLVLVLVARLLTCLHLPTEARIHGSGSVHKCHGSATLILSRMTRSGERLTQERTKRKKR